MLWMISYILVLSHALCLLCVHKRKYQLYATGRNKINNKKVLISNNFLQCSIVELSHLANLIGVK